MKINSFAFSAFSIQNIFRIFLFTIFLLTIFFAAAFVARAQDAEKPSIERLLVAIDRNDLTEFNRLIAAGVDLKQTSGDARKTALLQAAATGTPEMLRILISKSGINDADASKRTAVFYATVGKKPENLKLLIKAGADLTHEDSGGATAEQYAEDQQIKLVYSNFAADNAKMWAALKANDSVAALRLMTTGNASANQTVEKQTPLIFAAAKNDAALFDKIVNAGGNPAHFVVAVFPPYRTALDAAAEAGGEVLVKKILTADFGARKTAVVSHALAAAIRGGHDNLVPILLGAGANVNEGFDFTTPIHAAVKRGDAALLKTLVTKGATKAALGTALEAAFDAANSGLIFQILLDAGADVNQNIGGFSAMTLAVDKGNVEILKTLVARGAEQQTVQDAFVRAAEKNQVSAMRFLLSAQTKPDLNKKKSSLGSTPLVEAAKNDAYEAIKFLVVKGADINLVTRDGFDFDTPLTIAARKGDAAMINFLMYLGAKPNVAVQVGMLDNTSQKTALDFAANKPEALKTLQNPASPEQVGKYLRYTKHLIDAGDFVYQEKLPDALAEYESALGFYSDSQMILLRQVSLLLQMKNFETAAATAQKAVEVCEQQKCSDATFADAHNYRAVALIRQQKFQDAFTDANKAVEFCAKSEKPCSLIGSAYNNRGVVFREQKQFNQAIADLTKAIEAMPDSPRPYFHRAKTYLLLGDRQKARADLTKAKSLAAQDEEIQNFQLPASNAAK